MRRNSLKNYAAALVCGVVLAACTSVASETRLSSALRASEFNDVASKYMERPTFVSLQTLSDNNVVLKVRMDEYGTGYDPTLGVATEYFIYFDRRFAVQYLPLIDKYLEWEALATQRGDMIEREIGGSKTWGQAGPIDLKFSIYSGNATNHYLVIDVCAVGSCLDKPLQLSRENAIILRRLISDFGQGRLGQLDQDVYK